MQSLGKSLSIAIAIAVMGLILFMYSAFIDKEFNTTLFIISLIIIVRGSYLILTGDTQNENRGDS